MTESKSIIYLQKDKFEFYSPSLPKVLEFLFVPEIVQDLDIVNPELLENLIKLFVTSNKIPPSELIIVIAENACFVEDFTNPSPVSGPRPSSTLGIESKEQQTKKKEFLEHVPFDSVASITFPLQNGIKVCATNENLFKGIIEDFKKMGFRANVVVPVLAYTQSSVIKPLLDIEMANFLLLNSESVKKHNFLSPESSSAVFLETNEKSVNTTPETPEESYYEVADDKKDKKTNVKRLIVFVGIFVVLLIVMVVMLMNQPPI